MLLIPASVLLAQRSNNEVSQMAYRRRSTRRSYRQGGRSTYRRTARRATARRSSYRRGRTNTVRLVIQQAPQPVSSQVFATDAGLMAPASPKGRAKF